MKKFLVILFLFITFYSHAQYSIEGVWSSHPYPDLDVTFGFDLPRGELIVPRAFELVFDLSSEEPSIIIHQFSWDKIISINEKDNITELTFYFARGEFDVTIICHINEDGTMWIEDPLDGNKIVFTGENYIYYKMGNITEKGEFEPNLEYIKMVQKNRAMLEQENEAAVTDEEKEILQNNEIFDADNEMIVTDTENNNKFEKSKLWYLLFLLIIPFSLIFIKLRERNLNRKQTTSGGSVIENIFMLTISSCGS